MNVAPVADRGSCCLPHGAISCICKATDGHAVFAALPMLAMWMMPGVTASYLNSCIPHAQVFQGLILASRDRFMREAATASLPGGGAHGGIVTDSSGYLAALWVHECERVFCDKMITSEDKGWVEGAIADLARCVGHLRFNPPL